MEAKVMAYMLFKIVNWTSTQAQWEMANTLHIYMWDYKLEIMFHPKVFSYGKRHVISHNSKTAAIIKFLINFTLFFCTKLQPIPYRRVVNGSDSNQILEDPNANSLKIYNIHTQIRIQ
jgi:hypothetical protein